MRIATASRIASPRHAVSARSDRARGALASTSGASPRRRREQSSGGHEAVVTGPRSWPDGAVGRVLSHRGASTRCRAVGEPETGVVAEDPPLDGDGTQGDEGTSLAAARGLLLAVPVLWATYNPALRFIYDSPTSPTPAELTSVRMLAAMVPFTAVFLSIARDAASTFGEDGVVDLSDERKDSDNKVRDVRLLLRAGAELGLLNFLGTACQAWGLEQTTATRAGFLLSTINVGVPLFAAAGLGGVNAPAVTGPAWAACALALLGVLITDYSPDLAGVQPGDGFNAGDLGVLAAAVCYAAFTVRLGKWAREYDGPEDLAAVKLAVMFLWDGKGKLIDHVGSGI